VRNVFCVAEGPSERPIRHNLSRKKHEAGRIAQILINALTGHISALEARCAVCRLTGTYNREIATATSRTRTWLALESGFPDQHLSRDSGNLGILRGLCRCHLQCIGTREV